VRPVCKLSGHILRWVLGGMLYGLLEIVWRGYTHWTMMLLAALLCVPLDILNETALPWETPLWAQAVIGGTDPQCMAGAGDMGLLRAAVEPLGADMPAVCGAVVSAGGAGDCCV